jgi:hypothetical protein
MAFFAQCLTFKFQFHWEIISVFFFAFQAEEEILIEGAQIFASPIAQIFLATALGRPNMMSNS